MSAAEQAIPKFPMERPENCPFDPPAEYARLRTSAPVGKVDCPAGVTAWLVTRREDARSVLVDTRLSSRGALSDHVGSKVEENPPRTPGVLHRMDGEEHARFRRALAPEFTEKRAESFRPFVQEVVEEQITALLDGPNPTDFYRDFAIAVPGRVICTLLGVPYEDIDYFTDRAAQMNEVSNDRETVKKAGLEVRDYMDQLITRKTEEPSNDLLSRLIRRSIRGDRPLTHQELISVGVFVLVAGHESTAHTISSATALLLQRPEQLARLKAEPAIAARATEELLRYLTLLQFGLLRYATEDLTLGGHRIKAGEWVIAGLASGNRDEEFYPEPDELDLHRDAPEHLSFGYGIHKCLGRHFARVQLQEIFSRLFFRIPSLRLAAPPEELGYTHQMYAFGVKPLPLTWDRA